MLQAVRRTSAGGWRAEGCRAADCGVADLRVAGTRSCGLKGLGSEFGCGLKSCRLEGCGVEGCGAELGCGLGSRRSEGCGAGSCGAELGCGEMTWPPSRALAEPRAARPGNGAPRLPRPGPRLPPLQPAPSPPPSATPAAAESRGPVVAAACGTLAATPPSRGRGTRPSQAGRGVLAAGTGGHGLAGRQAVARAVACPVSSLRRPRPAHGDRCPGRGLPGRWRPRA